MEKDIFIKLKMDSRGEVVNFLKSLWCKAPQPCPLCSGELDSFHKKAKKSNSDWIKVTGVVENLINTRAKHITNCRLSMKRY